MSAFFNGDRLTREQALALVGVPFEEIAVAARAIRDVHWSGRISYSRKVFIPLTRLCRDVCHYCTFAASPRALERLYLSIEEVLEIARAGVIAGCKEALFTLGDRPEARYPAAREALVRLGHETTLSYLREAALAVLKETGLLPHLNPGLMSAEELAFLRPVAASMGVMLETSAARLSERGEPHFGSPDKHPDRRLHTLRAAGKARVPMTSGILIGIGETRAERIEALFALRDLNDTYGHIQEVIIQNFRAKPGTRMAAANEPTMQELLWTVAIARLVLGPNVSLQAPPNLFDDTFGDLIDAGINDFGGVSPVTPDHVNPEAAWPSLTRLDAVTRARGAVLVERLSVYPRYIAAREHWIDPMLHAAVLRLSDGAYLARAGQWTPGCATPANGDDLREIVRHDGPMRPTAKIVNVVEALRDGRLLTIASLFEARGDDFTYVTRAANRQRQCQSGDNVTYVSNRNINYTNICLHHCSFCAFSKGSTQEDLRGRPYLLSLNEIADRVREAATRGATEVCMQGGIHPKFDGATYLEICRAVKNAAPRMHIHAFSPLEVLHGAQTLGLSVRAFLIELKRAGLGSLPGTAAEVLDDDVRRVLAPGKPSVAGWLNIVRTAHEEGLKTTSTIMFGHVDHYGHWAQHLLHIRSLQQETGGLTEFVPLPFVHMEAPMYLKGRARRGPTLRETILMHAVSRLVLGDVIANIQVSWVKLGLDWAVRCLDAGANDIGGVLMNESISRAAGAVHGQELDLERISQLIDGRRLVQRRTLYDESCAS
ncbi:MAG TPA: 5-amino-6-(D-ribitylamino)uracil--L-tyrosine 4-hydroxyphenyl transferase CofH [Terricaulis sp.]|nr:5-amino-6-(D-ribitylamino)uracil--L-tyrosine 4-hydroxyphenyl transferase CofH [Terricaulis sp.]